jgi:hypothetical protein
MKTFNTSLLALATVLLGTTQVSAKLPPPSDEAKAKAAETAAKAAWTDKVGAYKLCLAMDQVAARYLADAAKAGKAAQPTPTPPCADPGPFAYTAPAAASQPAAAGTQAAPGNAGAPPASVAPAAPQASAKKP